MSTFQAEESLFHQWKGNSSLTNLERDSGSWMGCLLRWESAETSHSWPGPVLSPLASAAPIRSSDGSHWRDDCLEHLCPNP